MAKHKYTIGVNFGTESGRALLVDVNTGEEVATAVHPYANGVIDEKLPESGLGLEPDWALQDPNDYLEVFKQAIPAVLKQSGVDPADVIGIATDFTACTILPTKRDGTPLCFLPEFRNRPHAWVKLWKHHAAQPEANKLNAIAASGAMRSWIATAVRSPPSGSCPRSCKSWTKTRPSMQPPNGSSRPRTG